MKSNLGMNFFKFELSPFAILSRRQSPARPQGSTESSYKTDWNQLRGLLGYKVNALMAAIGHNLRLILKVLSILLQILKELFADLADTHHQIQSNAIIAA